MDHTHLIEITLVGRSGDDVVRADEERDQRWAERREQRQLMRDEIVGAVTVDRWIPEDDRAPAVGPEARQYRRERTVRRGACSDRERVTEGKPALSLRNADGMLRCSSLWKPFPERTVLG
jgi:hypothetical protein